MLDEEQGRPLHTARLEVDLDVNIAHRPDAAAVRSVLGVPRSFEEHDRAAVGALSRASRPVHLSWSARRPQDFIQAERRPVTQYRVVTPGREFWSSC